MASPLDEELRALEPPPRLLERAAGRASEDWLAVGDRWVETMRRWAALEPRERVLDIGCGVGRVAIALASFLEDPGRYVGFDAYKQAIEWCKREIEPRWPLGRFVWLPVRSQYLPWRGQDARRLRLPFDDGSFDFVFATSVFTHMPRDEVANYLRETARVLRSGGRCLATYYVLSDEARAGISAGRARYSFGHARAAHYVELRRSPRAAVAYDESALVALYDQAGLSPPVIHHGAWSGGYADARHGQDTAIAVYLAEPEVISG